MTVSAELNTDGVPLRLESRQRIVHVVEYSHYPRRLAAESRRVAYTQDRSRVASASTFPSGFAPVNCSA